MDRQPLDYATPLPKAGRSILPGWAAFSLLIIQIIWFLPALFWSLNRLEDGQPKRPVVDLVLYAAAVIPSIIAIGIGFMHCWTQYKQVASLRNCKLAIFAIFVAIVIVAFRIYGWFDYDIVHRNVSRDFW